MPESRSIFEKQDIYSKLEKVNKIILEPDFWGNKSKAEKTLKEKKLYEDLVQSYDNSLKQFNEIIDLYQEDPKKFYDIIGGFRKANGNMPSLDRTLNLLLMYLNSRS